MDLDNGQQKVSVSVKTSRTPSDAQLYHKTTKVLLWGRLAQKFIKNGWKIMPTGSQTQLTIDDVSIIFNAKAGNAIKIFNEGSSLEAYKIMIFLALNYLS